MTDKAISATVQAFMKKISDKAMTENHHWATIFNKCYANTLQTTVQRFDDNSTFLVTGDIPAMWLRDSTAQVRPYLPLAQSDTALKEMIAGLVAKQFQYINLDPYANAFNASANGAGHQSDKTKMSPWIWERKYEIDSLCYPVQLAYLLYKNTGDSAHFTPAFTAGIQAILTVWETEQNHEHSSYRFERDTTRVEDTLPNGGAGSPVGYTGMTWSGFRPSDDVCQYGYLVPSNMFAIVVLRYLIDIYTKILPDAAIVNRATALKQAIEQGIQKHALVKNEASETIFAFEVDGLGNYSIQDDSNVPSLIAAPYLGYCAMDDPIYLATRQTLLSSENPYFYEGKNAKGIGSSHTPPNYIWPIALAIEGMTTTSKAEKKTYSRYAGSQ
ncbi:glycoside hydrolase family 125 protein [Brochothrix campestris]|uniref:glycoside hydrolase family 125 protein n=1 Tax=Brochothrix campestris TaxID=2757 RepID=UPI0004B78B58